VSNNESKIQTKIIKFVKERGGYVARVMKASKKGVPDLLICYRGRFIGCEVKVSGEDPTPLQVYNLDLIGEAGGLSTAARCVEDVEQVLRYIDDEVIV